MTNSQLFLRNIIAIVWDYDKTLTPGYMQEPLFKHFDIDERQFWQEVKALPDFYERHGLDLVSPDALYLNHLLTYVREGKMKGLTNKLLRKLGTDIAFYPGLPDFFEQLKKSVRDNDLFRQHDIQVEHYVISTGLRQMVLGSKIAPYIDGAWGCEFVEQVPPIGFLKGHQEALFDEDSEVCQIGYVINNTTKTRALFEINKGTNKIPEIDVNAKMEDTSRRVPFRNMIYVADGPSDIPCFSLVKEHGGLTYAVYKPGSAAEFAQANELQNQERVDSFGEANYQPASQTSMWLQNAVNQIAQRITKHRARALGEQIGRPPVHIDE